MDHITHEIRLANWKSVIEQCQARSKTQSVRQWLKEHDISEKRYYYWQRKIRKEAYSSMLAGLPVSGQETGLSFAEIPVSAPVPRTAPSGFNPDAVIRTEKVTVELSNTISDQLLSRILGGLTYAE